MRKMSFSRSFRFFFGRIRKMVSQPIFIALTIFGNFVILCSASGFYFLEYGLNPNLLNFVDALWWSVATVSTVGYGDVVPITYAGRILGIFTVIIGAALFWSYTALFAEALLSKEIVDFESQLRQFNKSLKSLERNELLEDQQIKALLKELSDHLNRAHSS